VERFHELYVSIIIDAHARSHTRHNDVIMRGQLTSADDRALDAIQSASHVITARSCNEWLAETTTR